MVWLGAASGFQESHPLVSAGLTGSAVDLVAFQESTQALE